MPNSMPINDDEISHVVSYCIKNLDWDIRLVSATTQPNGHLPLVKAYFVSMTGKTVSDEKTNEIITKVTSGLKECKGYENITFETVKRKLANYYSRFK